MKITYAYLLATISINILCAIESNTIETGIGKTIIIALPENPTTGYSWYWQVNDQADKRPVELIKKEFVPKEPSMIGAGGTARFTFKAQHVGNTSIVMTLKRIWEKNSESEYKRFELVIHPAKQKKTKRSSWFSRKQ